MAHGHATFKITLTRWDAAAHERRNKVNHLSAEDFCAAYCAAQHMVNASNEADPDREYEIAHIERVGISGIDISGPGWLTMEEFSAKVKAEQEANQ